MFFASQTKRHVKGPRHNCSSFLPAFLSTEAKRLFTSKIIQRAEISSASVNIAVSLLHVCPPTEPARLLGVSFFSFLLFSPQHNACFLTLSVCARALECVHLSTEESTRWVCFPSELVNRSRAVFMCRVHYHGDGCDGNPAAAAAEFDRQQLAATFAPLSPQFFFLPRNVLCVLPPCCPPPVPVLVLTCPQSSSPTPMNTHHNHWSMVRAVQENGFPPNWTMII